MLVFRRALVLALLLLPALLVSLLAAPSWAAAPMRLTYRAPAECPPQAQFERAVSERGADFDQVPGDLAGAELKVALGADAEGFTGTLELAGVSPLPQPREVHAARCEEAVRGLAVITALLLRPEPLEASAQAPQPASPPSASDTSEPASTRAALERPRAARLPPSRLTSIGQFQDEGVEVEAGTVRFEHALNYTLGAGVDVGLIPGLAMPRYDFTFSRINVVALPGGDRYLVGGWLPRVRWSLLGSSTYRSGAASVDLFGVKAMFGGCSSFVYDLDGLVLLFCGELGAGAMRMATRDAPGTKPREKAIGMASAGTDLTAQYNLGSVFHVDARIGGELTFPGIVAERADGSEIFSASLLSAHALVGIGLHF